jgi:hypothetical protein
MLDPVAIERAELREERSYRAKKQEAIRAEWYEFFSRMADTHREISEDYQRRAEALLDVPAGGGG